MSVIAEVDSLLKDYVVQELFTRKKIRAVNGVSFKLEEGSIYCLLGESGSGKSTIGLIFAGLEGYEGSVKIMGKEVRNWVRENRLEFYRTVQIVFQDPYSSINPFYTARAYLEEPVRLHWPKMPPEERYQLIFSSLKEVDLEEDLLSRRAHQLSGGQRQRLALARSILLKPKLLILDEVTSSLDSDTQNEILDLIRRFNKELGVTILFITHDLKVAKAISDWIILLREGKIQEITPTRIFFGLPVSDYGRYLLSCMIMRA